MSEYDDLGAKLGCPRVQMQANTIDRLGADPGIPGGREFVDLELASVGTTSDASAVTAVAAVLSPGPRLKAACVAGAFEIDSRVVDATGLPTGPAMRRELEFILDTLGLGGFPHAGH